AADYLKHISQRQAGGMIPAQKNLHNRMSILATLFAAGVKARKLTDNPFKSVIPAKSAPGAKVAKRRGFTDAEATKVLRAARREQDTWRRWGPWLMSYSGMRVTEVSQLRRQDIEIGDDTTIIHIRTEAGHVKNGTDRLVPVHAALVAEGFLAFVAEVVTERLFPQACLDRQGHRNRASDGKPNDRKAHALNSWVRKTVGITDKTLDPNHAWRHRFRVVAQMAGMDVVATDRIVGHSDGHMRNTYLTDEMRGLLVREMAKFPALTFK
ncbi:MAG: tyrosine-type recombinase/integrase, partial [Aestuariivirga sp.]